jgi:gas vesicle protein
MDTSKILVGFLVGAAAGALAGILFAPDKGSITRKKIANKTGDVTDSVKNSFNDFVDGLKGVYSDAKVEVAEMNERVKSNTVLS